MSSSTPNPRFLLDENVKTVVSQLLMKKGYDVKNVTKGSTDSSVAALTLNEKRVLVTNDYDFVQYTKEALHGLILLRLPQNETNILERLILRVLAEVKNFQGKIIVVDSHGWKDYDLPVSTAKKS